jgi:receptor protein-tyrosine kinase
MLKALKNLEARGAPYGSRPSQGPGSAEQTAGATADLANAAVATIDDPADALPLQPVRKALRTDPTSDLAAVLVASETIPSDLAFEPLLAAEQTLPLAPVAHRPLTEPAVDEPANPIAPAAAIAPYAAAGAATTSSRATAAVRLGPLSGKATPLERTAERTLGDPLRSQPLRELADRLHRDAAQTGSKTILLVGVGAKSSAQQPLLLAGALLAQKAGPVLLVDADFGRRRLSAGLEASADVGLAEVLAQARPVRPLVRPTAFPGLALLPAGLQRELDSAAAAAPLEAALRELAAQYALLLIDGGTGAGGLALAAARVCDATYLVAELGTVEAQEAQAALQEFRASGARILGAIAT